MRDAWLSFTWPVSSISSVNSIVSPNQPVPQDSYVWRCLSFHIVPHGQPFPSTLAELGEPLCSGLDSFCFSPI